MITTNLGHPDRNIITTMCLVLIKRLENGTYFLSIYVYTVQSGVGKIRQRRKNTIIIHNGALTGKIAIEKTRLFLKISNK